MSKPVLGLLLGVLLGAIDGASAWFYEAVQEEVRIQGSGYLFGIIGGSTFKGLVTGLAAGWAARRWNSLAIGVGVGLVVGFVFAYLVVYMGTHSDPPDRAVTEHPMAIIIPGTIVGAICGVACFRYGKPSPAVS